MISSFFPKLSAKLIFSSRQSNRCQIKRQFLQEAVLYPWDVILLDQMTMTSQEFASWKNWPASAVKQSPALLPSLLTPCPTPFTRTHTHTHTHTQASNEIMSHPFTHTHTHTRKQAMKCQQSAKNKSGQEYFFSSVQFSSVTESCLTLCDPMNRSTPGLPVHHQLPEFTQTHVHQVGDAIQPSHPLSSPSPPAPNPSQHQSLFQWVNSSHEVAKVLEFRL